MNYNSLMNKPTINYRELIGDNTVSEVGGITEEEFDQLLNTDLSSYYTKAQIDDLFSRSFVYREKSGSIVTFDCPESTTSGITKVVSDIVAVQSGTGDPSPTNIRPITGWDEVNVTRCEKNLIPTGTSTTKGYVDNSYLKADGTIGSDNTLFISEYFKVPSDVDCAWSSKNAVIYNLVSVCFYDENKNYISGTALAKATKIITIPSNVTYCRSTQSKNENNKFQLELGTTATTYSPYNEHTYTTTLKDGNSNPLICYGGELSNENGVQTLTLTHGYIASYNGETLPSTWISDRDVYSEGTTPTTGAEVVYALATSQQITQDTLSITSIAGINNIWCDSGDITVKALDRIIQG